VSAPEDDPFRVLSEARVPATSHEFDAMEEAELHAVIRSMRRAAWLVLLFPVASLVTGLRVARQYTVYGPPTGGTNAVLVSFGVRFTIALTSSLLLFRAVRAFERVVSTEGNDIPHMMDALRAQSRYFWLQLAVVAIGVALSVLGGVLVAMSLA
jgi:hypothetical protein